MARQTQLLIVIADGEHVRFVRPAGDNALHGDGALDSRSAHKQSSDLGSDRPGASMHTGSTAHHALAPRHDLQDQEKEQFAHGVAHQLNASAARGEFGELVIVAPAHTLSAIQAALDTTTQARVVGTLAKDLVKTPDDALWPHVREWVRPVHHTVPFSQPGG